MENKKGNVAVIILVIVLVLICAALAVCLGVGVLKFNTNSTAASVTDNKVTVENTNSKVETQVVTKEKTADERTQEFFANLKEARKANFEAIEKALNETTGMMPSFKRGVGYMHQVVSKGSAGNEINGLVEINKNYEAELSINGNKSIIDSNVAFVNIFGYGQNGGKCLVLVHYDGTASFYGIGADIEHSKISKITNAKNVVGAYGISAGTSEFLLVDIDGNAIVPEY